MKDILIFLFTVMCVFGQNAIGAEIPAKGPIIFEVDSIFVERRPRDINELAAFFGKSEVFDSNYVDAIESLNRQNVFGKPDVDVGYLIYFEFYAETEGKWQFEFVYDAGIASGVFVDDEVILFSDLDLWLNVNRPIVKTVTLKKGWHIFEFLALENGLGAPIRFRVKKPDSDKFKIISEDSLKMRTVAE